MIPRLVEKPNKRLLFFWLSLLSAITRSDCACVLGWRLPSRAFPQTSGRVCLRVCPAPCGFGKARNVDKPEGESSVGSRRRDRLRSLSPGRRGLSATPRAGDPAGSVARGAVLLLGDAVASLVGPETFRHTPPARPRLPERPQARRIVASRAPDASVCVYKRPSTAVPLGALEASAGSEARGDGSWGRGQTASPRG